MRKRKRMIIALHCLQSRRTTCVTVRGPFQFLNLCSWKCDRDVLEICLRCFIGLTSYVQIELNSLFPYRKPSLVSRGVGFAVLGAAAAVRARLSLLSSCSLCLPVVISHVCIRRADIWKLRCRRTQVFSCYPHVPFASQRRDCFIRGSFPFSGRKALSFFFCRYQIGLGFFLSFPLSSWVLSFKKR